MRAAYRHLPIRKHTPGEVGANSWLGILMNCAVPYLQFFPHQDAAVACSWRLRP